MSFSVEATLGSLVTPGFDLEVVGTFVACAFSLFAGNSSTFCKCSVMLTSAFLTGLPAVSVDTVNDGGFVNILTMSSAACKM